MVLWETEFYAISMVTGKMELFKGMFIQANTLQQAVEHARAIKLDYLQFTGDWYEDMDTALMDKNFYEKLTDPKNIITDMTYDDFMDWLDLALSRKDLEAARGEFVKAGGLEEYIKIIDLQIKLRYGDKEEGDSSSEVEENQD